VSHVTDDARAHVIRSSIRIIQSREVRAMIEMFQRTSVIAALGFGFALTAAWTALIGYGLFRLAELALQWSL
jgi:hypothetical protein